MNEWTRDTVRAALFLYATPIGPMPQRRREALLEVAGNPYIDLDDQARIQREIERFASRG